MLISDSEMSLSEEMGCIPLVFLHNGQSPTNSGAHSHGRWCWIPGLGLHTGHLDPRSGPSPEFQEGVDMVEDYTTLL